MHAYIRTLLLVLLSSTAFAQSTPRDATSIAAAAAVSCEESGVNRSQPVKSPLGFTAVAEVRAVRQGRGKEQRCITSWILVVSGPKEDSTEVEVQSREDQREDNEWSYENSFEIIGWSQDSTRLLTVAIMAGGDWDEATPVVYDFQRRRWWRVELAPVFSKVVPKDCLVYFRPMGFTPTGEVAVAVAPLDSDTRCFARGRWALNYEKKTVLRIRGGPK